MTASEARRRRGLIWALIGGIVLLVGIVAIVLSGILRAAARREPVNVSHRRHPAPTGEPSGTATEAVVDATVVDKGWVPEPITTDPETSTSAPRSLRHPPSTPQKSTREEWLDLPRHVVHARHAVHVGGGPRGRHAARRSSSCARASSFPRRTGTRSRARTAGSWPRSPGDITYVAVPDDASGDMRSERPMSTLTFTRSDGSGGETSYDETVRVSVQVLCGEGSVPTPNTAQQAGDCKVVRYFTEPLEP